MCNMVEAYTKTQGLFRSDTTPDAGYSDTLELDLATVEPSLAGPRRPQDRVPLKRGEDLLCGRATGIAEGPKKSWPRRQQRAAAQSTAQLSRNGSRHELEHGSVVIAAITSCTNTSNPAS